MRHVKLGSLSEFIMGQAPNSINCNKDGDGIPFVKAGQFGIKYPIIYEWTTTPLKMASKKDVLICVVGATAGKINLGCDCSIGRSVSAIRCNREKLDYIYLYYYLKTWVVRIREQSQGSAIGVITKDMLNDIYVPLFTLNEQKKIVKILDKAQELIDKRKAQIEALNQLVKSRFIEMFGDPITNSKEFDVVYLNNISELITKGASPNWQGIEYVEDDTQTLFITSENVREGYLDLEKKKYLQDQFNEKQKRSILKKGDFLVNIVGASIGRAAQFNLDVKANINQAVALVRIKNGILNEKYLLTYLNSPKALQMYNSMQVSVARANLSLQNISDLEIILPPIELQNQFADFVNQIDKLKFEMENNLKELENNFNSLMQKAFRGELFN